MTEVIIPAVRVLAVAAALVLAGPAHGWPTYTEPEIPVVRAAWLEGQCAEQQDGSFLSTSQPIINLFNTTGFLDGTFTRALSWQVALDVANSCNDDFVIARGRGTAGVYDFVYLRDYGQYGAAFGVNVTPPGPGYVFQVGVPNGNPWGAVRVRYGKNTGGPAFTVIRADGSHVWSLDYGGRLRFRHGGTLYEGPNGGLLWKSGSGAVTQLAPP